MNLDVIYKTGSTRPLITVRNTKVLLDWVINAESGVATSNEAGIWLNFNRNVIQTFTDSNGDTETKKADFVKVPVSDLQIGERGAKAFNQLIKLCKEEIKSEPF